MAERTAPGGPPEDLDRNRSLWEQLNACYTDEQALELWRAPDFRWGLFGVPERTLGVIGDVSGLDVVELGCGTAYVCAWLARAGARPVGVDLSAAQLRTARRCQVQTGLSFPLIEADAAAVPLHDAGFDLAISEYGASVWCEPDAWVAEAARLLRPGGRLVFLTNSVLACLCVPADGGVAGVRLLRGQRDAYRVEWPDAGIEYHPSHSDWIRALTANGFTVEALRELYAPEHAVDHEFYEIVSAEWASQWPVEDLWVARRQA